MQVAVRLRAARSAQARLSARGLNLCCAKNRRRDSVRSLRMTAVCYWSGSWMVGLAGIFPVVSQWSSQRRVAGRKSGASQPFRRLKP